jgi:hypothetical protein
MTRYYTAVIGSIESIGAMIWTSHSFDDHWIWTIIDSWCLQLSFHIILSCISKLIVNRLKIEVNVILYSVSLYH